MPGETAWSELESFLRYLGATTGQREVEDGYIFHGSGGFSVSTQKGIIANSIGFLEREGVIELIYIYSEGFSDPLSFQDQWVAYSPYRLLEEYGVPSRVWLESTSGGPTWGEGRAAGYILWVFYDRFGFVVLYKGSGDYGPTYHFCPRFEKGKDIQSLEIYIQAPDHPTPVEKTAGIIGLDVDPYPHVQSIEKAAGLNTTEFYNLIVKENGPACFDTPRDIWP